MIEQDSIERRERIFTQLREASLQVDNLAKEYVQKETEMIALRRSVNEKEKHVTRLARLVNVMIKYDCCPVEAQLKYSDEIDINENDVENNIGYDVKESYPRGLRRGGY